MSKYKGIARYTHLVNPSAAKNTDKLMYSNTLLIHKSDPQCTTINAEVEAAKANGFPSGFPANGNTCWNDCAVSEPGNVHIKDYMSLKASTKADQGQPVFVDANLQPIIDPGMDGKLSGEIVWVDVGIASYSQGSEGVKAYLNGIMVAGETGAIPKEALSGKPTAQQMFGASAAPAPAAPAPAAPAPAAPAPAAPAAPTVVYQMTEKAGNFTREQYQASDPAWTDEKLIADGLMLPPNGVAPSFS